MGHSVYGVKEIVAGGWFALGFIFALVDVFDARQFEFKRMSCMANNENISTSASKYNFVKNKMKENQSGKRSFKSTRLQVQFKE